MLRNHCGWAWRRFVAFLLFSSSSTPACAGAFVGGLPPIRIGVPTPTSTYSLSGYVDMYGGGGISGVMMTLDDLTTGKSYTGNANSAGEYYFGDLTAGNVYTRHRDRLLRILRTRGNGNWKLSNFLGCGYAASPGRILAHNERSGPVLRHARLPPRDTAMNIPTSNIPQHLCRPRLAGPYHCSGKGPEQVPFPV